MNGSAITGCGKEVKVRLGSGLSFVELARKIKSLRQQEMESAELRYEYEGTVIDRFFNNGAKQRGSESKREGPVKISLVYQWAFKIERPDDLKEFVGESIYSRITKPKVEFHEAGYRQVVQELEEAIKADPTNEKVKDQLMWLKKAIGPMVDTQGPSPEFRPLIQEKQNKTTVSVDLGE